LEEQERTPVDDTEEQEQERTPVDDSEEQEQERTPVYDAEKQEQVRSKLLYFSLYDFVKGANDLLFIILTDGE